MRARQRAWERCTPAVRPPGSGPCPAPALHPLTVDVFLQIDDLVPHHARRPRRRPLGGGVLNEGGRRCGRRLDHSPWIAAAERLGRSGKRSSGCRSRAGAASGCACKALSSGPNNRAGRDAPAMGAPSPLPAPPGSPACAALPCTRAAQCPRRRLPPPLWRFAQVAKEVSTAGGGLQPCCRRGHAAAGAASPLRQAQQLPPGGLARQQAAVGLLLPSPAHRTPGQWPCTQQRPWRPASGEDMRRRGGRRGMGR